jgi:GNAT superfamily N-acetyltransferase
MLPRMATRIVTAAEEPALWERSEIGGTDVWPEFNLHGDVLNLFWGRLDEDFGDFQFVLWDDAADAILAEGHSIPCAWDGTPDGLPPGIDGVIEAGFELRERGGEPNSLSALAIEISSAAQGQGLSKVMIEGMAEIAARHAFGDLIAPVRPNWKERYPLTPIDRYAAWTNRDGLPFDPWMRVHARLGGEILLPEPHSLRITGSVSEWEEWVGLRFPESGTFVIPRGLAPLEIDLAADVGRYWEPNVWMRHTVSPRAGG